MKFKGIEKEDTGWDAQGYLQFADGDRAYVKPLEMDLQQFRKLHLDSISELTQQDDDWLLDGTPILTCLANLLSLPRNGAKYKLKERKAEVNKLHQLRDAISKCPSDFKITGVAWATDWLDTRPSLIDNDSIPIFLPVFLSTLKLIANPDPTKQSTESVSPPGQLSANQLILCGDFWEFSYMGSKIIQLKNLKGVNYIHHLVSNPGKQYSAIELGQKIAGSCPDSVPFDKADGLGENIDTRQPLVDDKAIKAILAKKAELEEEQKTEVTQERRQEIEYDIEEYERYLSNATRNGQIRAIPTNKDLLQDSIRKAIQRSVSKIQEHLPNAGEHLFNYISTSDPFTYSGQLTWK